MNQDLELLVRRLRSGLEREEAARRLDHELRPRLRRYFAVAGTAEIDREDLVQQTLMRVFQGIGGLRAEGSFIAWLFVVARNVARTSQRHKVREERHLERDVDVEVLAERTSHANEEQERTSRRLAAAATAIAGLPEQQRRCLVLAARDGLAYREIADLLGLSALTVRNHLAEARRRLRREVGEEGA